VYLLDLERVLGREVQCLPIGHVVEADDLGVRPINDAEYII
jgi:hypothetical protein